MKQLVATTRVASTKDVICSPQNIKGAEVDILAYICGYIIKSMKDRNYKLHDHPSINCLKSMESTENFGNLKLVCSLDRGGLVRPNRAAIDYCYKLEEIFRCISSKATPCNLFMEMCESSNTFKLFRIATTENDLEPDKKNKIHHKFLKLFFNVRIHHYAKDMSKKLVKKQSKSNVGLRKSLK